MAERFVFLYEMDDLISQASMQLLSELHLKAKPYGILTTSAQAKHQPAFIWLRGRWAGALSSLIRGAS